MSTSMANTTMIVFESSDEDDIFLDSVEELDNSDNSDNSCDAFFSPRSDDRWDHLIMPPKQKPDPEFGSLDYDYDDVFVIRLHLDNDYDAKAEVGKYYNVLMEDIADCLESQGGFQMVDNLRLILEECSTTAIYHYMKGIESLLESTSALKRLEKVKKFQIVVENYENATEILKKIGYLCPNIVELTVGKRSNERGYFKRRQILPAKEADFVMQFLRNILPRITKTLRCLRVYDFIHLQNELSDLLIEADLCHLTVSRINSLQTTLEMDTVTSLEYDGQGTGFSNVSVAFMKKIPTIFRKVKAINFTGVHFSPLIETCFRHLLPTGKSYRIYQPNADISQIISDCNPVFQLVQSSTVSKDFVTLLCSRNCTRLILYKGGNIYLQPL